MNEKEKSEREIKARDQKIWAIKTREKERDVQMKIGEKWDKAREIYFWKQLGPFEDRCLLSLVEDIMRENPYVSDFMKALKLELDYLTIGIDPVLDTWYIYVKTFRNSYYRVSLDFFKMRSPSELWVYLIKVRRSSELNELLRDSLWHYADHNSPQINLNPFEVGFLTNQYYRIFKIDEKSLSTYPVDYIIEVEIMLRSKGFVTDEKQKIAEAIRDYCTMKNIQSYFRKINKEI